jgi:hypothetical protein
MATKRTREMNKAEFAAWHDALPAIQRRVERGESDAAAYNAEMTARGFKAVVAEPQANPRHVEFGAWIDSMWQARGGKPTAAQVIARVQAWANDARVAA